MPPFVPTPRFQATRPIVPPPVAGIDLETQAPFISARDVHDQLQDLQALVEGLCRKSDETSRPEWPESLFQAFTELLALDFPEDIARQLIERLRVNRRPTNCRRHPNCKRGWPR